MKGKNDTDWLLSFTFDCPALPSANWVASEQCYYVWGDVDFDRYGPRHDGGRYSVCDYMYRLQSM